MRRRISWLVAATTSAIVLAFVIPLCLLVREMAADRAIATGNDEARSAAIVVSGVRDTRRLGQLVREVDLRNPASTSVVTPDGRVLGSPAGGALRDGDIERARRGEAFTDVDQFGGEVLIPVETGAGTYVVLTIVPIDVMRAGVMRAWLSIGLLGLALLAAAMFFADRLGRRVSEPVTQLAHVAERLGEGDLEARAELRGPPETVELADTMNRMAARIEELLLAERAAVGDLSHRLRTPVTALRLDAEAVDQPEVGARLAERILQLQLTIDAIVRDARRPLRRGLGSHCDARVVVAERTAFWTALAEDQGRPVTLELPDHPVPVALDASDLTDIVDVLVDNVFAHTADDVGFGVRLATQQGKEGPEMVLEVTDLGGPATPPQSADEANGADRVGSTGLGLQIVRRTAAGVGGHLTWHPGEQGTVARVTLPLAAEHAEPS